jgi:hypothetical protein
VGWVPVDLAYAVVCPRDAMRYFGEDSGNLLVAQVDPDVILPHSHGSTAWAYTIHPGPSCWFQGPGTSPDHKIAPLSWQVAASPRARVARTA